jgi:FKBP-type peptidyl-prolyl cis-trans isomerase FkpA
MKRQFLLFGLLIILFSACKKTSFNDSKQAQIDDDKIKAYIAANHIDVTKDPSGIYYGFVKLDTGNAHPKLTDTVQVNYTGKLLNGTVFDTESASIIPLAGTVKGWQIAIPLMTYDGSSKNYTRMRLIIPSALGYGSVAQTGGTTPIPANSVLDFTIDLIGFYGPGDN